jgi:hypothetical protein
MHDGGLPSNIEKVVLCIDGMMVGCPATYEKVVFCIDGMMVGCPATYEKSGVMHRWHDGGLPSNI